MAFLFDAKAVREIVRCLQPVYWIVVTLAHGAMVDVFNHPFLRNAILSCAPASARMPTMTQTTQTRRKRLCS
ncbi:hypothetical protein [Paraburkholderia sp. JHI869]|uniref:hypothetical protein n=1 Tax=Paraburkholderia sp. JHI869 TaxID=3112959 RepID=UPI00316C6500